MPAPISLEELREVGPKIAEVEEYIPSATPRYVEWEDIKEPEVSQYVAPGAIHGNSLAVIRSYGRVLRNHGSIPEEVEEEINTKLNRANVPFRRQQYWEDQLRHDVRGLVRASQEVLSERARYWLYLALTSYDVLDTAWSMSLRDLAYEVLEPKGISLARSLIDRAKSEKTTVMTGRTHKQHAAATTAGHWLLEVLGGIMPPLSSQLDYADDLRGKISGFIGTTAAQRLLFGDNVHPRVLEEETLQLLHLKPDPLTGQVVHQSYYVPYFGNLVTLAGAVAKFAEDVRNYQQTEVGEVFEQRLSNQVGSSTGAHKRNPINSENLGGFWREILPRLISVYEDLVTDFQRDLRNSANRRYYGTDIPFMSFHMLRRTAGIASGMTIRKDRMAHNLGITQGLILGEPLQLVLQVHCARQGKDVDTHEYVRKLTDRTQEEGKTFWETIEQDPLVQEILPTLTEEQKEMLLKPERYLGTVEEDVDRITGEWGAELDKLEERIEAHKEKVHYI